MYRTLRTTNCNWHGCSMPCWFFQFFLCSFRNIYILQSLFPIFVQSNRYQNLQVSKNYERETVFVPTTRTTKHDASMCSFLINRPLHRSEAMGSKAILPLDFRSFHCRSWISGLALDRELDLRPTSLITAQGLLESRNITQIAFGKVMTWHSWRGVLFWVHWFEGVTKEAGEPRARHTNELCRVCPHVRCKLSMRPYCERDVFASVDMYE
jgi:hypothetical protein